MAKKKIKKKAVKKVAKKKPTTKKKLVVKKVVKAAKAAKPVGKVLHYYTHIKVAIIRFNTKVKAGTSLRIKGATTDFAEAAKSMQYDHAPIAVAPKGKQIGIKFKKRVREGDSVYIA